MPAVISPATTIVKVVPREGELEITLNINITLDGNVSATSDQAEVKMIKPRSAEPIVPEFKPGAKIRNFSKE
jgi:hypothetical protein